MSRTDLQPTESTWALVSRDGKVVALTEVPPGGELSTTARVDQFPTRAKAVTAAKKADRTFEPDPVEEKVKIQEKEPTDGDLVIAHALLSERGIDVTRGRVRKAAKAIATRGEKWTASKVNQMVKDGDL